MSRPDDSAVPVSQPSEQPAALDISERDGRPLGGMLEAVLFVADEPLTVAALAHAVQQPPADVEVVLGELSKDYSDSGRGFELRRVAGGYRLYTGDRFADVVERYVQVGQQARLTQAALETLAIVAYRQPVTRARAAAIRGVSVDGVFRSLVARGLVEESGSGGPGGAFLYRTTQRFLEQLGLNELADLPSLAPLLPETGEVQDDSSST